MSSDVPSASLLVQRRDDALQPYAIEDLQTGRRVTFDALPALLAALSASLAPARAPSAISAISAISAERHPVPGVPQRHPGEDS
jgi:hypothetical protein